MKKQLKVVKQLIQNFQSLKEKLGLCLYEETCDEKEFILMSEKVFYKIKSFEKLKEENEKLRKENENEKVETRNEKLETRNEKVEMTNENKQF